MHHKTFPFWFFFSSSFLILLIPLLSGSVLWETNSPVWQWCVRTTVNYVLDVRHVSSTLTSSMHLIPLPPHTTLEGVLSVKRPWTWRRRAGQTEWSRAKSAPASEGISLTALCAHAHSSSPKRKVTDPPIIHLLLKAPNKYLPDLTQWVMTEQWSWQMTLFKNFKLHIFVFILLMSTFLSLILRPEL